MTGNVELSISDSVGHILIARPEKLNAITRDMAIQLRDICREIDDNDQIKAATITGAGERAFSAGSDLNALADISQIWNFRNRVEYAAVVRDIRKPVIAGLKGWVLGGGMEIALAADIRVAGKSARIGFPEVTRGWVGGGGASQMLPRLVGYGQAMRLLLMGEPIEAEEAFRLGLVEFLVEDGEVETRARGMCERLASFSPVAVEAVKASVRAALSAPLAAGLAYENEMNTLFFAG